MSRSRYLFMGIMNWYVKIFVNVVTWLVFPESRGDKRMTKRGIEVDQYGVNIYKSCDFSKKRKER